MAMIQRWKVTIVFLICLLGIILSLPNFMSPGSLSFLPESLTSSKMRLGLDLQGGSYLQLQVDVKGALEDRFVSYMEETRSTLRQKKIAFKNLKTIKSGDVPYVTFDIGEKVDPQRVIGLPAFQDMTVTQDGRTFTLTLKPEKLLELQRKIVNQSISVVEKRIDQIGTTEPEITAQGTDRIVVQLPGLKDPEQAKRLINKTAKLTFHLVEGMMYAQEYSPNYRPLPGTMVIPDVKEENGIPHVYYVVRKNPVLSGDNLVDANQGFHPEKPGNPVVNFEFDSPGGRRFADLTRDNIGRAFAIVLDGKVITAPNIGVVIPNGRGLIEGNFTIQSANELAILMRAGALPATLTILEEKTVGPSLGSDSIAAGQKATILSVLTVAVMMIVLYGAFGAIADIALVFNVILLIAGLSLLEATLTLPGIAGIALTVGMAVDANVLIFERIREELKAGKKAKAAIALGYERAIATIVDSNVTTVMGAILLFWFGTGSIRGFAITLCLGIGVSMFTAIMLTRVFAEKWLAYRKNKSLTI